MHAAASRRFSLSKRLGLDCTKDGLTLAGVPLLHRTVRGFTPRDELEIRWLLERAYGSALDTGPVIKGIKAVARALNESQLGQAAIRALLLDLHELDWTSAARLAQADDALAKFDPDERRDERGAGRARTTCPAPVRTGSLLTLAARRFGSLQPGQTTRQARHPFSRPLIRRPRSTPSIG